MRHAGEQDLVIPVMESQGSEEQYEGATVIEPKKGKTGRDCAWRQPDCTNLVLCVSWFDPHL
jgi:hypothetical protein